LRKYFGRHSASNGGLVFQRSSWMIYNDCLDARISVDGCTFTKEMSMEAKLYVGNLSYDTTEDDLRTAFTKAGTVVSVDMIKDRYTGQMKGFAFVTMNSGEEAQEAIKILNEKMLADRAIKVNIARPREERPQRGSYDRR
jgi:RNA recognition motif-containing protein